MNLRVLVWGLSVVSIAACTSFGSTSEVPGDAAASPDSAGPAVDGAVSDGAAPAPSDASVARDTGGDAAAPSGFGMVFVSKALITGWMKDSQNAADALCATDIQKVKPGAVVVALLSLAPGDGLAARLRGSKGPRHVPKIGGGQGIVGIVDVGSPTPGLGPVTAHADGSIVQLGSRVWTGGFDRSITGERCTPLDGGGPWSTENAFFNGITADPLRPDAATVLKSCDDPQHVYCVEVGTF